MESNLEVLLCRVARLGGEGKRAILKCSSRTNIKICRCFSHVHNRRDRRIGDIDLVAPMVPVRAEKSAAFGDTCALPPT